MPCAFFITGTDTDAGKSVVTAGLLRALAAKGVRARAVKPVQTGCTPLNGHCEAPDVQLYRKAGGEGNVLKSFVAPCSPHLAARLENARLDLAELAEACRAETAVGDLVLFEGAGGLYVPLNEQDMMLDLLRELRLPAVLIIANRLGCINHAILSLNALENAGLDAAGMVLCRTLPPDAPDPGTTPEAEAAILEENSLFLKDLAEKRRVPFLADIPFIPNFSPEDPSAWNRLGAMLMPAAERLLHLAACDAAGNIPESGIIAPMPPRALSARETLDFDRTHLWHPYTSALAPLPVREVTGTLGTRIFLRGGRELIDGMSSWWCALHGYGNKTLVKAAQRQAARFSHVMFGGLTHAPAVELGRRLLPLLPKGLAHIFYADSGSVAVEVAMKMAMQFWRSRGNAEKCRFVALRGAYHGDTIGAMSLCDPVTGMHTLFTGLLPRQIFVERPTCRFHDAYDPQSFTPMERTLREHAAEIAAVVVEPIVQGAGGMWFYHPQYLHSLRCLCDELGMLLIADEIATGFGRTGRMFACEWAGITPDILCMGKAMTGGMMTFSAVAATTTTARGISSAPPERGGGLFMHGPTFMANPLACAVACASIDTLLASSWRDRVSVIEHSLSQGLAPCRDLPGVADVRVLGAIGVVETEQSVDVERWQDFFVACGVWIRPFGHTVYVMPPLIASPADLDRLTQALCAAVRSAARHGGAPQIADIPPSLS
ncbi:MAG: adenosylmethionine--8-amino-7-oxononanoate transaminase [Desulfovibrio sp.]|nr:adenosylmethionine--8-amino-7-oxononanoate transaminase [Desulfovibrio sp.]